MSPNHKLETGKMKNSIFMAAFLISTAIAPIQAIAQQPLDQGAADKKNNSKTIVFDLTVSPGAVGCLPKATGDRH
jgi:hypothetical protein